MTKYLLVVFWSSYMFHYIPTVETFDTKDECMAVYSAIRGYIDDDGAKEQIICEPLVVGK